MKFNYIALGRDNQKLTGSLEASSLEIAQQELHKMDLSIITLNEILTDKVDSEVKSTQTQEAQKKDEHTTYYFLAKDPQGKEINGTIDSNNPYLAYKRLITEYQFDVLDLEVYQAEASEEAHFKSNFEAWQAKLRQEGVVPQAKIVASVKNELADEGERMAEEIVHEIDHFIVNTKKIISEHSQQYSKVFLQQIQNTLGNLERIRSSNNLNHITKVCNDLYNLISHPDVKNAENDFSAENQEYKSMVANLKDSGFVQKKNNFLEAEHLGKKAESFEGIKGIFSKIQKKLGKVNKPISVDDQTGLIQTPSTQGVSHTLSELGIKYFHYFKERNPILKRARKQEFDRMWKEMKAFKNKLKIDKKNSASGFTIKRKDFSGFFMELNSFVGWLLFFYITYFFLASFSLERNIGLSEELVIKTLNSPLVINICIFLLLAHLMITLKIRLFRQNFIGTTFLFFFTLTFYMVLMSNL